MSEPTKKQINAFLEYVYNLEEFADANGLDKFYKKSETYMSDVLEVFSCLRERAEKKKHYA